MTQFQLILAIQMILIYSNDSDWEDASNDTDSIDFHWTIPLNLFCQLPQEPEMSRVTSGPEELETNIQDARRVLERNMILKEGV